jgi:cytochrome c biogenesis protein CcdA/thiol-disulfide isomerase/thioredoxin
VALLLIFALVAGFATCLTPCVLPVLPIALSAGATGGRRRPLGIVTGLVVAFTFATVALVYVIGALGLPNDVLRRFAVVVLLVFGISLIVPSLSARFEAFMSRFGRMSGDADATGFASGFVVGLGLGTLYAPCAGPILAGVVTVSAAQTFTAGRLAVALAYAVGSAAGLYLIMLGGRRLTGRLVTRSVRVQQALGVLMVAVAVAVSANLDVRFQTAIASDLPGFLVAPTQGLESSGAISKPLSSVRGGAPAAHAAGSAEAASGRPLPVLGRAPEFTGTQQWFNTPGGEPLTMAGLRGQVVLVDFWTYTCINCIRTLPHLKALYDRYHRDGLEVVGVHSPEFPFEKEASNVEAAIAQNGLPYPVVQDNDLATWNAYGNQYWPADYLVDAQGRIRYVHFGEGDYEANERAVRSLLAEAGAADLGGMTNPRVERPSGGVTTPESYLGALRAERFANLGPGRSLPVGTQEFALPRDPLPRDGLAYAGRWRIDPEDATALSDARLDLNFGARRVFLVMGTAGEARRVGVYLDGKPIPDAIAGPDVHHGVVTVEAQRLYRLVDLPGVERHVLELRFEPGVSGYAFTFG